MSSALLSSLHLIAFAIGVASLWGRARALRSLAEGRAEELSYALRMDALWGLASLTSLATGLARLLSPLEKGTQFYLHNYAFFVKMALFVLVGGIEVVPMTALLRWRRAIAEKKELDTSSALELARVSVVELALLLVLPVIASLMARGVFMVR